MIQEDRTMVTFQTEALLISFVSSSCKASNILPDCQLFIFKTVFPD